MKGLLTMIAWISLFVPPLIATVLRQKLNMIAKKGKNNWIYEFLVEYVINIFFVNIIMMFCLNYIFKSQGNLVYKLNAYNNFAFKYMLLALIDAIGIVGAKYVFQNKMKFIIDELKIPHIKNGKVLIWLYATVLFMLNFVRIFDNNFWGDETFTTNLVQQSFSKIVSITAADVHPPLYYFIVRIFYLVFGKHGWVFHLVSLIPCFITIVFAMTVIWKKVAPEASLVLITLLCLSNNAVTYNVEVRMYSWAALFVLFSFYEVYRLLQDGKTLNYVLFVFFSLAAAYTHYYALLSVAFFYICIIGYTLFFRMLDTKNIVAACLSTVILYLPWMGIVIKTVMRSTDNFWLTTIPTFKESIDYLFSYQIDAEVGGALIIGLLFVVAYETNFFRLNISEQNNMNIIVSTRNLRCSKEVFWIIAGLISILGTIIAGIVVSEIIRPFYLLRYIYPVSIVAWMVLGIGISKLKGSKFYTFILICFMLLIFIPAYKSNYIYEKNDNIKLQDTLYAMRDEITSDKIILTNLTHVGWTIAEYYFPDVKTELVNDKTFVGLQETKEYILIVSSNEDVSTISKQLNDEGFVCDLLYENGVLGTVPVDIYSIAH